ncbi:hypothetical protein DFH09DRAFT_1336793 [Mycena vulgaris]|nr:hypothetical protein DFH09DRAFT_1336793 [Mycena vulgaris]
MSITCLLDKVEIEGYLRASGTLHDQFLTLLHTIGALKKTDTGYTFPVPKYGPDDSQLVTWGAHDLGAAALALLLNYKEHPEAS